MGSVYSWRGFISIFQSVSFGASASVYLLKGTGSSGSGAAAGATGCEVVADTGCPSSPESLSVGYPMTLMRNPLSIRATLYEAFSASEMTVSTPLAATRNHLNRAICTFRPPTFFANAVIFSPSIGSPRTSQLVSIRTRPWASFSLASAFRALSLSFSLAFFLVGVCSEVDVDVVDRGDDRAEGAEEKETSAPSRSPFGSPAKLARLPAASCTSAS
mmetsp:Transcript_32591/g.77324  ORF Transcript_32591/g.77324 Transcript_32591/m.77324 type:complete len:216 (+) Transcript_32591:679-1326(+)